MNAEARLTNLARERTRVLAAAERVMAERGAHETTIETVCAAAGVSPAVFHSVFEDREDMLLAVFVELTGRIAVQMGLAYESGVLWVDRVRAAVLWVLGYLDSEPLLARFLLVESFSEERVYLNRGVVISRAAQALQAEAPPIVSPDSPAPFGSEAVVGTVASVLHGRLLEQPVPPLGSMAGSLMALIVLPFLGTEASRQEIARSSP